ncbi:MAG: FtsQ-type POTRA domain-containing protein [Clostridia bacterium]|nr:FtsQ-type POTRA domain-containing protein [Clostridia bacterium]
MDEELRKEDGTELISDDVKRRLRKSYRRRNAMIVLTCLLIGAVMLAVVGFFTVKSVFTVNEINCPDTLYYSAEEILSAAGVKTGQGIFFIKEEELRRNALQSLPLLKDLRVEKGYPDKLTVTPVPEQPLYYFVADIPQNEYVVVAESRKVLCMFDEEEQMRKTFPQLFFVKMPRLLYTVEGQGLGFAERGDEAYFSEFLGLLKGSSLYDQIVLVDLENRFEITVYCKSPQGWDYRIYFGNRRNMEEKLAFAEGIRQRLPEDFTGVIGVEDPQKGYADPDEQ